MKTILVPTDFSEVATNAAKYAISFANDVNAKKIILYNAYQPPPILPEAAVPAMPIMEVSTMKDISDKGMREFQRKLQEECPTEIQLDIMTGFSILLSDINEVCENADVDLIVMGITGTSRIEEILIGSTALSVVKQTTVPVIIVPGEAKFSSVKNVMLASDFKKVVETTPINSLRKILDATKARLQVVNVYENSNEMSEEKTLQQALLNQLLEEYNPEFHFENSEDFIAGINHFVEANNIDLIIAIPRKHKLFEGLFKERHTKKLAFHSHVPLMYIHQQEL